MLISRSPYGLLYSNRLYTILESVEAIAEPIRKTIVGADISVVTEVRLREKFPRRGIPHHVVEESGDRGFVLDALWSNFCIILQMHVDTKIDQQPPFGETQE